MLDPRARSHSYPGARIKPHAAAAADSSAASSADSGKRLAAKAPTRSYQAPAYGFPSRARRTLMRISEVARPPMDQLRRPK